MDYDTDQPIMTSIDNGDFFDQIENLRSEQNELLERLKRTENENENSKLKLSEMIQKHQKVMIDYTNIYQKLWTIKSKHAELSDHATKSQNYINDSIDDIELEIDKVSSKVRTMSQMLTRHKSRVQPYEDFLSKLYPTGDIDRNMKDISLKIDEIKIEQCNQEEDVKLLEKFCESFKHKEAEKSDLVSEIAQLNSRLQSLCAALPDNDTPTNDLERKLEIQLSMNSVLETEIENHEKSLFSSMRGKLDSEWPDF